MSDDFEPIKVPHGEGGGVTADAQWIIAEAMRLTAEDYPGRVKFYPGAKLAYWSLINLGWTPPGNESDDEATRLRAALEQTRGEMDEIRAHDARTHESEQKADNAYASMAIMLNNAVHSLREQAKVAQSRGEPEPTLPVTKVATTLEKALNAGHRRR